MGPASESMIGGSAGQLPRIPASQLPVPGAAPMSHTKVPGVSARSNAAMADLKSYGHPEISRGGLRDHTPRRRFAGCQRAPPQTYADQAHAEEARLSGSRPAD